MLVRVDKGDEAKREIKTFKSIYVDSLRDKSVEDEGESRGLKTYELVI